MKDTFSFAEKKENAKIAYTAEMLWSRQLQWKGFSVVNLNPEAGKHGPDLIAFGRNGMRFHLMVGAVKGTKRTRVLSLLEKLEDDTIQMSAEWINRGLSQIAGAILEATSTALGASGLVLEAVLSRLQDALSNGELDLYLLRARDMLNNTWQLRGYQLLTVEDDSKGVKRGPGGRIHSIKGLTTVAWPSIK